MTTETNCARLNGPTMSSLRRMNSTRKRSIPASSAHQPISSPGRRLVAPLPQPPRHAAHHEELVDRRRVHLVGGRDGPVRIGHRPRQVGGDAVVAVARELAAEPPDRVADRERGRAHVEQPVVEEAAVPRVGHHRERAADRAAVEHEPGAGEQAAEVALLDDVPELRPRDPARAGAEHHLVDPVDRQPELLQAPRDEHARGDEREREHQPEGLQLEAEDVDLGEHRSPRVRARRLEVAGRVDRRAAHPRLEVQVVAEAVAGAADGADDLARLTLAPFEVA